MSNNLTKQYINDINKHPLLTSDEVTILADDWHKTGNIQSLNKIINSNLKFAIEIAYKYKRFNKDLDIEDLVQVANCGLIRAAKKFSSEKKCKFSVYAAYWIKAELNFYLFKSYGIKSQAEMKLFFKDTKLKYINQIKDSDLKNKEIDKWAKKLKVKPKIVKNYCDKRSSVYLSLQDTYKNLEDSDSSKLQDTILPIVEPPQETMALETEERENIEDALKHSISLLNMREQDIIRSKYFDNTSSIDIAQKHNISRQRVRQITKRAISKLQDSLKNNSKIQDYLTP